MCAGMLLEVRGQLVGVSSLLQSPPGISGPQAWHQSPLPAEPCCLPKINSVSVAKYISVNLYLFHMYENIPMGLLDIYI